MNAKSKREVTALHGAPQPVAVETYEELHRYAKAFADGHLGLLLVIGMPGVGKSRAVNDAIDGDFCLLTGAATAFGMYSELYRHCDEPVVIDDVDALYRDAAAVRLLKSLCQTESTKTLMWKSATTMGRDADLPSRFTTKSHVAIIANDWKRLNEDVLAIEDRGHVIRFAPSPVAVHTKAAEWFWDQEVFDFLAAQLPFVAQPSFRIYVKAAELKSAGMDWRSEVLRSLLPDRERAVMLLKSDSRFASEEERVREFVRAGHGSRATYFNVAKRLTRPEEIPKLVLKKSRRPDESDTQSLLDWLQGRGRRFGSG